jgi:hypothetical protein
VNLTTVGAPVLVLNDSGFRNFNFIDSFKDYTVQLVKLKNESDDEEFCLLGCSAM